MFIFTIAKMLPKTAKLTIMDNGINNLTHTSIEQQDWIFTDFQDIEESLPLTSIQCELPLQEIYERVTFPD